MDAIINSLMAVSALEWAAAISTVVCIWFAGQNSVLTWPTGILAVFLYGILFYEAKLYADTLLQLFFGFSSVYGWLYWNRRNDKPPVPITSVSVLAAVGWLALGFVGSFSYSRALIYFTDSPAPYLDSMVLVFSLLGQFLLMRRNIENWPVWIFVNTISVPLYFSRELYLTSFMYALFWVHAWYAWWKWSKEMKAQ